MPEPGSRSKETILFMVPGDEDVFGTSLAAALEGRALWMDSPGWGEQAGAHRLLRDALDAGHHVQAFLRVTDDDGVPTGPGVQYLASRVWRYENGLEFLRDGRLAYKWFAGEEPDWLVERFNALIRLAWQHLVACTHPHVADLQGRWVRRARIGSHAKAWLGPSPIAGWASGRPTGCTRCDLTTAKAQSHGDTKPMTGRPDCAARRRTKRRSGSSPGSCARSSPTSVSRNSPHPYCRAL